MIIFSLKPIRLFLQLLSADAFIGERDKTACGRVVKVKQQGTHNRLQIITDAGESCVWRLSVNVVKAICELWSGITLVGLSSHSDTKLDYLAEQIRRCPEGGNVQLAGETSDTFPQIISWHVA